MAAQAKSILRLVDMWSVRSAAVSPQCACFKLKTDFQRRLRAAGIKLKEDEANRVPHVDIDGDPAIMKQLNESVVTFAVDKLFLGEDVIWLDVGFGRHMTLVFTDRILDKKQRSVVIKALAQAIEQHIEPIQGLEEQLLERLRQQRVYQAT